MFSRLSRAAHRTDSDAGIGMILVIGLSGVMTILVGVLISIVVNSLDASARHNNFDAALASAESGIDQGLARLQRAYVDDGALEYYTPSTGITGVDPHPTCNAPAIPNPGTFATPAAERIWAKAQIAALLLATATTPGKPQTSTCLQHAAHGDFVVIKPQGKKTIYAEGWSPSYATQGARTRLVKAEYLFEPYAPTNAILAGCNLDIGTSTTVSVAPGVQPGTAAVHTNCNLTTGSNCGFHIDGPVSMTGTYSGCTNLTGRVAGDSINGSPAQPVPSVTAWQIRSNLNPSETNDATHVAAYRAEWYDMCTVKDANGHIFGEVEQPTPDPVTGLVDITPCNANETQVGPLLNPCDQYAGFQFPAALDANGATTWTVIGQGSNGVSNGIYYFNGANVVSSNGSGQNGCSGGGLGSVTTQQATIIASAITSSPDFDPGECQKVGGNIDWNHNTLSIAAISNLFMFADADLTTESAFTAGSAQGTNVNAGFFIAGDQIHMSTSSQGAYGAVLAEDQCPAQSGELDQVNNPTVYFDPNSAAPFTSVIDTTLWLEYVG